jgi:hypothetical protein
MLRLGESQDLVERALESDELLVDQCPTCSIKIAAADL